MEFIIYKRTDLIDGRISVAYLIRNNADVRLANALLPAGADVTAYATDNVQALYDIGIEPPAIVSGVAMFESVKNRDMAGLHMGAIFGAFQQLQMGGSLADMKLVAKQVYAQNDAELAKLLAFINTFKNATDDDKDELMAIAIYAASTLVTRS